MGRDQLVVVSSEDLNRASRAGSMERQPNLGRNLYVHIKINPQDRNRSHYESMNKK